METRDSYEFKRIESIINSIEHSADPRINHAYHKGFLMAVLARAAMNDNRVIHILEQAREGLMNRGFKRRINGQVSK